MVDSSVTSSWRTVSLSSGVVKEEEDDDDDEIPWRRRSLTPRGSVRTVARMGIVVVRKRYLVRLAPIPRLEGVMNIHGYDIV